MADLPPQAVTDDKVEALYEPGWTIRAIPAELVVHQRSVAATPPPGRSRTPARGRAGVALSRRQLERLDVDDDLALAEVARRSDVDPHVVTRDLDRYGFHRGRPPLDRGVLEELSVPERLGIRAVAARLDVGVAAVRAGLAEHGIPVRRP